MQRRSWYFGALYWIYQNWYTDHTPALLHSLFPNTPDNCWRCGEAGGTLFHIYWDCPSIRPYWVMIQTFVQQVIEVSIPLTPLAFLLNAPSCALGRRSLRLLLHILTAAKCLIATFWKRSHTPSLSDLCTRIKEIRTMEHLTALLNSRVDQFNSIWSLWDCYAAEHDI